MDTFFLILLSISEQVTIDHEPDDPAEKARVEAKGGKIAFHPLNGKGGCWRVNGDLAMTRSFGDPNGEI